MMLLHAALMQGREPFIMYVDDPKNFRSTFLSTFGECSKGLMPGDIGLRGDIWHWVEKFSETWLPGHASAQQAKTELYQNVLFIDNPDDLREWIAAGKPGSKSEYVRNTVPPPAELTQRYMAWYSKWGKAIDPIKTQFLFTEETDTMHQTNLSDIDNWYLSGG
jgi:hypothetical protein